jgi:hypothetical protein
LEEFTDMAEKHGIWAFRILCTLLAWDRTGNLLIADNPNLRTSRGMVSG